MQTAEDYRHQSVKDEYLWN